MKGDTNVADKKEKTAKLSINYNAERLRAIERYAAEKNVSIEPALVDSLDDLYKKIVPAAVRDYIENK